jgi:hypothetical protein
VELLESIGEGCGADAGNYSPAMSAADWGSTLWQLPFNPPCALGVPGNADSLGNPHL